MECLEISESIACLGLFAEMTLFIFGGKEGFYAVCIMKVVGLILDMWAVIDSMDSLNFCENTDSDDLNDSGVNEYTTSGCENQGVFTLTIVYILYARISAIILAFVFKPCPCQKQKNLELQGASNGVSTGATPNNELNNTDNNDTEAGGTYTADTSAITTAITPDGRRLTAKQNLFYASLWNGVDAILKRFTDAIEESGRTSQVTDKNGEPISKCSGKVLKYGLLLFAALIFDLALWFYLLLETILQLGDSLDDGAYLGDGISEEDSTASFSDVFPYAWAITSGYIGNIQLMMVIFLVPTTTTTIKAKWPLRIAMYFLFTLFTVVTTINLGRYYNELATYM